MIEQLLKTLGSDWLTIFLSVSFCLTLYFWWSSSSPGKPPPGPTGLPFLGILPEFVRSARSGALIEFCMNMNRKYGRIVMFKSGSQNLVWLGDGKLVTKLFNSEEFALRPIDTLPVLKIISGGSPKGIIFTNGENNREMRKFALMSFRDFGVGKKSIDEMVQTEASILCDYLIRECEKGDGLVSNIKLTIQYATANVIHHIIFGYRWDYDNPEWRRLVKRLYDFFAINLIAMPENFIPALKYVPPLNHLISRNQDKTLREVTTAIEEYVSSQIEEHRSSYCEGEIRDFVDLYIKYEQEHKEFYTKENIFQVILDLFRAGSDTTATSISWATLYLVKFPDIQEALREEIDKAIGSRSYVKEDKPKLIKTRAFVNEVHRHVSVAPLAPPHTVDKPTQVEGYTIPPNTLVQPNLYFIHHDDQYWTDPDKFDINRWIGEDGELLKHEGHFMPFSIGKRVCPGRQIANVEFFALLIEMLQKVKLEKTSDFEELDVMANQGILRTPPNFTFKVSVR